MSHTGTFHMCENVKVSHHTKVSTSDLQSLPKTLRRQREHFEGRLPCFSRYALTSSSHVKPHRVVLYLEMQTRTTCCSIFGLKF